jgi:hypothetical protein
MQFLPACDTHDSNGAANIPELTRNAHILRPVSAPITGG